MSSQEDDQKSDLVHTRARARRSLARFLHSLKAEESAMKRQPRLVEKQPSPYTLIMHTRLYSWHASGKISHQPAIKRQR